jgi:uncharacterized protein (UPF0548 family)
MFFLHRPSPDAIEQFLSDSRGLSFSYEPVGLARSGRDHAIVVIGNGRADYECARHALAEWKQFDLGWVELFPRRASYAVGSVVAVLITHLGFWSLNGCRVVYHAAAHDDTFGYAYGTLPNHAESGEELFEVAIDRQTGEVSYRIRASSEPQSWLARLGQPYVRILQQRFRRDSAAAMKRAVESARTAPR